MERDVIRLECLKLAVTGGREIADIMGRAKTYEDFVVGTQEETKEQKPQAKAQKTRER